MTDDEIAKIAAEVVKLLAKEIYGDALKPGMTQVGRAIETVLGLGNTVLTPIAMVNDKVKHIREANLAKLEQRLGQIKSEKIIPIHPEIAVPVLRKLEYTQNENLAELFLNLLATAANIDTAHWAHPAFVNIISNLSPDEAKLLKFLQENQILCHGNVRSNNKDTSFSDFKVQTTILEFEDVIQFTSNSRIYISNLIGLGIISEFAAPKENEQFGKIEEYLRNEFERVSKLDKVLGVHFRKGCFGLTEFGELFMRCCT